MTTEMSKAFDPGEVEARWYAHWEREGVFDAPDAQTGAPAYCLQMPPPNVTGSLHMGHAMRCTFEDTLVRYHRMSGFDALFQPGMDHAGIATQTVVERQLKREGLSRHDLGREEFTARVWRWRHESGGRIALQQRELGASPDWKRSVFTMDPGYAAAVREAFCRLYEEGLIYRATRLVNWDCEARTVLSDLEVENEEGQNGELYEFAYAIDEADGGGEIVVATTRPETMLGDTAVAVHPDDERYRHLIGKRLRHPFVDRLVPVIGDAILVDPKFGTGAVKVTPAHDFNDFATGKRHGLLEINILTLDGKINEQGGRFAGLDRFEARKAVKRALAELKLARGSRPHVLTLPRSERSGTIVEPMISTQWFVKMAPLAEPALAAVRDGRTRILPEEWVKTYEHFLGNIQDWCISRQLWWGHQVPAFHCAQCSHVTVTRDERPPRCGGCGGADVVQDEDVLDTWFSSGLWPFATLGWPAATPALAKYYPGSDLETGYDILFFWVARMMMMGLHFMGEVPFRRVLLSGLIVDENGDKMSKVKGNVIDPLDLIHGATFEEMVQRAMPGAPLTESLTKFKKAYPSAAEMGSGFPAFGTDALRLTLTSYSPGAKRIALAPKRVEGYRHFCNKMWNATRFVSAYLDGVSLDGAVPAATGLANRWILSRLGAALGEARAGLDAYRLDDTTSALYRFFWTDLCDWFLELSKPALYGDDGPARRETQAVAAYVLEVALRALHPLAPFVTEELWQRLPKPAGRPATIAKAPYPRPEEGRRDAEAEREMAILQEVIGAARSARTEHELSPAVEVPIVLRSADERALSLLSRERAVITKLTRAQGEVVVEPAGGPRPRGHVLGVTGGVEVLLGLSGHVDPAKERERVTRQQKKVEKDVQLMQKRLSLPSFVEKAPPEVVEQAKADLAALLRRQADLALALELVEEL
ncbi:MAG: valine--tRNA ligase [Polyangiaceae bacterium]|nr:valine--tRNA ligase [Polyangiaceae bacterium]